jgi:hypothetical protein
MGNVKNSMTQEVSSNEKKRSRGGDEKVGNAVKELAKVAVVFKALQSGKISLMTDEQVDELLQNF